MSDRVIPVDTQRPWTVHTHLGYERFYSEEEANERLGEIREFFTTKDSSTFYVTGPDTPQPNADMKLRIAYALMEQANLRFAAHGPYDARGAAFWDTYTGLLEGTLEIPESVPADWGQQ